MQERRRTRGQRIRRLPESPGVRCCRSTLRYRCRDSVSVPNRARCRCLGWAHRCLARRSPPAAFRLAADIRPSLRSGCRRSLLAVLAALAASCRVDRSAPASRACSACVRGPPGRWRSGRLSGHRPDRLRSSRFPCRGGSGPGPAGHCCWACWLLPAGRSGRPSDRRSAARLGAAVRCLRSDRAQRVLTSMLTPDKPRLLSTVKPRRRSCRSVRRKADCDERTARGHFRDEPKVRPGQEKGRRIAPAAQFFMAEVELTALPRRSRSVRRLRPEPQLLRPQRLPQPRPPEQAPRQPEQPRPRTSGRGRRCPVPAGPPLPANGRR